MIIKDNTDARPTSPSEQRLVEEEVILDDIIIHLGSMGRYQKIIFLFMMPFCFFLTFVYFIPIFITATPENYWCKIPELSHLSLEVRRNLSAPGAGTEYMLKCLTYDANWTKVAITLVAPHPKTPKVPCKYGWEFEFTDVPYDTVVTEVGFIQNCKGIAQFVRVIWRGWVCDYANYVPRSQAVFFLGAIVGSFIFGWFADYYGRVPALVAVNLIAGLGGIATAHTSGNWDFVICRFITGLSFDNIFFIMYILALEYVGPEYRTCFANLSAALFYAAGCFILLGLALLVQNWRLLLWLTSLPMLFSMFLPLYLPESMRWYLSKGLVEEAVAIIRKFEKINKRKVPDDVMLKFITFANRMEIKTEKLSGLMKKVPLRLTVIIMLVVYLSCVLCYDVLVRMTESFGLHLFFTFAVTTAAEVPSNLMLVFILDRAGRKLTAFVGLFLTATILVIIMLLPQDDLDISQTISVALARCSMNMTWNVVAQWSTELLPTTVRGTGTNGMHLIGHVICVFSPFIAFSERVWSNLPLVIISLTTYIGAIACKLLPETCGIILPQTIAEAEEIVIDHTFWGRKFRNNYHLGMFVKAIPEAVMTFDTPSKTSVRESSRLNVRRSKLNIASKDKLGDKSQDKLEDESEDKPQDNKKEDKPDDKSENPDKSVKKE